MLISIVRENVYGGNDMSDAELKMYRDIFTQSGLSPSDQTEMWQVIESQFGVIVKLKEALKAADLLIEEYDTFNGNAYKYGKVKHYQGLYEKSKSSAYSAMEKIK